MNRVTLCCSNVMHRFVGIECGSVCIVEETIGFNCRYLLERLKLSEQLFGKGKANRAEEDIVPRSIMLVGAEMIDGLF